MKSQLSPIRHFREWNLRNNLRYPLDFLTLLIHLIPIKPIFAGFVASSPNAPTHHSRLATWTRPAVRISASLHFLAMHNQRKTLFIILGIATVSCISITFVHLNYSHEKVEIQTAVVTNTVGLTPLTIQSQILGLQPLVDEA